MDQARKEAQGASHHDYGAHDTGVRQPQDFQHQRRSSLGRNSLTAVAVAVPVRNEVARLPRLLAGLARQRDAPAFTVCLFFDNCVDGSIALVTALAPQLPYRIVTERCNAGQPPNAGLARGRATAIAAREAPDGVVLTTDADSRPASDWVAANLVALRKADVVAGLIERRPTGVPDAQHRIGHYFDRLHRVRRSLDPVPWESAFTHHWTSGASLGFSTALYRTIGGFAPRSCGEDAAFADAASRAGCRVRRDGAVVVRTSDRRVGRAEGGFAAMLTNIDAADRLPHVAHPDDEAWRFRLQAIARRSHLLSDFADLARLLSRPLEEVRADAAGCPNGEAFAARIVGAPPGGMRQVSLAHAEVALSGIERLHVRGAA